MYFGADPNKQTAVAKETNKCYNAYDLWPHLHFVKKYGKFMYMSRFGKIISNCNKFSDVMIITK